MAGRAKAGCGANLVEVSYSLNGSEFISFRLQANCSLSGALTTVHASGRLRLTRARASLSIEDDLNDSAARDAVTRAAYAGERVSRALGMSRTQPAKWMCA